LIGISVLHVLAASNDGLTQPYETSSAVREWCQAYRAVLERLITSV